MNVFYIVFKTKAMRPLNF